jgi:WD40 repeat protein
MMGGQWIDKFAVSPAGLAYSIGKKIFFLDKGKEKQIEINSSAGGLAFAPKGLKIAIAHYQGVTLWSPGLIDKATEFLDWKGSHLGVTFSPDSRFVVSTMQEPQLHGWRLSDKKDMRMSGYPLKVRSFEWTHDGKYLASSGAQEVILWSFEGKNGPMGEKPLMVAPSSNMEAHVSVVASHPLAPVITAGYSDGMVTMARLPDGAEVLIKAPAKAAITALSWRKDGKAVAYGDETGLCSWGVI